MKTNGGLIKVKLVLQYCAALLTILQHLHDMLFDHGKNDLSSQTTGNSIERALPSHSVTGEAQETSRNLNKDMHTFTELQSTLRSTGDADAVPTLKDGNVLVHQDVPVKVFIFQLISHRPLIIILEIHHHSQHLRH